MFRSENFEKLRPVILLGQYASFVIKKIMPQQMDTIRLTTFSISTIALTKRCMRTTTGKMLPADLVTEPFARFIFSRSNNDFDFFRRRFAKRVFRKIRPLQTCHCSAYNDLTRRRKSSSATGVDVRSPRKASSRPVVAFYRIQCRYRPHVAPVCPTPTDVKTEKSLGKSDSKQRVARPERFRTPDPQIRSLVLYPAELRALVFGLRNRRRNRRIAIASTAD